MGEYKDKKMSAYRITEGENKIVKRRWARILFRTEIQTPCSHEMSFLMGNINLSTLEDS
jgi:hypothetical protein